MEPCGWNRSKPIYAGFGEIKAGLSDRPAVPDVGPVWGGWGAGVVGGRGRVGECDGWRVSRWLEEKTQQARIRSDLPDLIFICSGDFRLSDGLAIVRQFYGIMPTTIVPLLQ